MALPAMPDELLVEILLRVPTASDLIRASAVCVSFHRLVADRSFLRRFRKLHPPPLLGFLDPGHHLHRFNSAVPPHPSAPAASAGASTADFSFAFQFHFPGTLCGCLDFEKLALEACKDPSEQRLPELQTPYSSSTTMTMPRQVVVGRGEGGVGAGAGVGAGPADGAGPGSRGTRVGV